jgi:SAM-dependent methyltransferase
MRKHTEALLDIDRLEAISSATLVEFRRQLYDNNFDTKTFLELSGKEVTRHVYISEQEEDFLRRQVLHDKPELGMLVDLFLLHRVVKLNDLKEVLTGDIIRDLSAADILIVDESEVKCRGYLTPIGDSLYLNDGNVHSDDPGHVIQLVLEQPYIIKTCKAVAQKEFAKPTGRILDICSGSGVIGQGLYEDNWQVDGLDINPRAIAYARFNAKLNSKEESTNYQLMDIREERPTEKYDVVVSNPPYNGYVRTEKELQVDITLHAGSFGEEVTSPILDAAEELLKDKGVFFMVGITLLKDGELWHPEAEKMKENGSLIVLHKPLSDVKTWEGMRLLFSCVFNFADVEPGRLYKMLDENDQFNQVAWSIIIYVKGGKPGYHRIYNLPTDAVLLPDEIVTEIRQLIE